MMIAREVPTQFKELLTLKHVHKPPLKERLKLILGFNLLVTAKIVCQHKCGKTQQKVTVELTDLERTPPTVADEVANY